MKKFLITLLLVVALCPQLRADEMSVLTVVYQGGTESVIGLEGLKRIDFADGNIVVKSADNALTAALDDVKRLEFGMREFDPSAISSAELAGLDVLVVEKALKVDNAPAGAKVNVYDASGKLVTSTQCGTDGTATLSLASANTGIYVIQIEAFTKKFIVK